MTSPCVFRRSVVLDAAPDEVFRFHEDPRNIGYISPPFFNARVQRAGGTARTGEEFVLELGLFGVRLVQWSGVWREVVPGRLLVDEARRSPFRSFRHRHEFEPIVSDASGAQPQTRMTDHVSYVLPGGWLGKLIGETVVRLLCVLIFADRHRRTRRWAGEQRTRSNLVE